MPDMQDLDQTPPASVICQMSGGPSDGARYEFEFLPIALGVRSPERGFYEVTEEITADGARIFTFQPFGD